MDKFIFNIDDGWNFSRLARRHLLHWHPSLKPECLLLSKYFKQFEREPEVLPWPRVVDDDVFAGIIANYEAAGELENLKTVAIIASTQDLTNIEQLIQNISNNRSTRYCLFLRLCEDTDLEEELLQKLITPSGDNKAFDLVFINNDKTEIRLQTIALTLDLLVSGDLFYDDFFRDAKPFERVLQLEHNSNNRNSVTTTQYEQAYQNTLQLINYWKHKETRFLIRTEEPLLKEIVAFHDTDITDDLIKEDELENKIPKPELSIASFFFRSNYFNELKNERECFDQQLDAYLETWFKLFNKQIRLNRQAFTQEQKIRIARFDKLLQPVMRIEIAVLEDATITINDQIDRRRKEVTDLLKEIQADITPQSRQAIQWNNQKNRTFKRKYFDTEENAVDRSYQAIKFLWNLQARKKIFFGAIISVIVLAVIPLLMLRLYQVGIIYWQNYPAWIIDTSWVALWLIPVLGGLLFSTNKRQNIVQKAVDQLESKLNLLFKRHKKACKAAEKYSTVRLYLQELGIIKKRLQNAKLQKQSIMQKIEQLNELISNSAVNDSLSEQAPENIDDWVSHAIRLSFTHQNQGVRIENDLAPQQQMLESSPYLPTRLKVSTFKLY